MERVNSNSAWPTFKITRSGKKSLLKVKELKDRWDQGSVSIMNLRQDMTSNRTDDYALLKLQNMKIIIYISDKSLENPLYDCKIFSKNLGNLDIEPYTEKAEEYESMRIRVNFPK
jgi:hypothetical protein